MKKLLFIILFIPIISNAQWSIQNYQFNVTNSGNVGIGTKTPSHKLHVVGSGFFTDTLYINKLLSGTSDSILVREGNILKYKLASSLLPTYAWGLNGNSGTNDLNNYCGTFDSVPFMLASWYDGNQTYIKIGADNIIYIDGEIRTIDNIILNGANNHIQYINGGIIGENAIGYHGFNMNRLLNLDSSCTYNIGGEIALAAGGDTTIIVANDETDSTIIKGAITTTNNLNVNGKVGIGTKTPAAALHIKDGSERLGVVTYSTLDSTHLSTQDVRCTDTIKTSGTFYYNNAGYTLSINTAYGIVIKGMDIIKDSAMFPNRATTLSDEEVYTMPTSMSWDLQISVDSAGKKLTSFHVVCDNDGTVMLGLESPKRWSSITYLSSTNSDGYFCVYDAGTGMAIKNRLGYTVKVTIMGAAKF